ncbi:ATP-binding protein [Shewanella sp. GXUN23E]|uniref:sensor histidine kinase n=1 Tax=Shewanella sp. GXUN23E TaxID=3422498 RepID=UPI003D7DC36D
MSIRRYLFLLISGVILLLSTSQLFLAWFFKGQLQQEVQADSRALSREVVSVVFGSPAPLPPFNFPQKSEEPLPSEQLKQLRELEALAEQYGRLEDELSSIDERLHRVSVTPEERIDAEGNAETLPDGEEERLVMLRQRALQAEGLVQFREQQLAELQRRWAERVRRQTEAYYRDKADAVLTRLENIQMTPGRVELIATPDMIHELNFSQRHTNDLLSRYVEWMLLLISITGLIAILLASWVISRFSRPLSELARGHRALGEGQLGVQIREQGVSELRRMLSGFNTMSLRLLEFSHQEQQMAGQQHLAELGQIARGIAHSLRNPLQTLGLLSESMCAQQNETARLQTLDKMRMKIHLMDKQIQSLLTLSANGLCRTQKVPLGAIVQDILLELSVTGTRVDADLQIAPGTFVTGAESEIRSILHAVLVNAGEASRQTLARILIDGGQSGEEVHIHITDWGCGLTPEQQQHLGQPHYTTKAEGTGMGLYIAGRLLEAHYGGKLMFDDNPEGGTVVTVIFREDA